MMGTAEVDSTKLLIDHFNLPLSVEEVISLTHQGYVKYFPEAKLLPGAEKLVRHLHSQGVPIAVATGSSEKKYDLKITHHKELFSLPIVF
ncbi:HDHD1 [Bugula neritina]|uniref:HDHD1 n=1 Tax=Bugula neritina TaxID=10212 RepID=A0A7J7JIF9_BUGNE|nr:HDHD1 [Bugula neritina]